MQGLYEPLTEQDITPEEEKRMNDLNGYSAEIQKIIDSENAKLNYFSLPGKNEIVPIHVYNKIDHKILLSYEYRVNGCKGIIKNRENNKMNLSSLIGTLKEKEGKNIETYFSDKSKKVNISDATELEKLCDVFNCDLFDGRIDKNCISETFQDNCHKYLNDYLFTIEFGDKDDKVLFMSQTPVFEDLLYYMNNVITKDIEKKRKLDQGEYRPKFVMVSGHEVTLMGFTEYMRRFLNKTEKIPNVPFASSVFLEVYRKEEKEKLSPSDYIVKYYINDDLVANFTFEIMNTTMRKKFWTKDEIYNFCEFDDWKEVKTTNLLIILVIIFSILGLVIVVTLIIVIVVFGKKIKTIPVDDTRVSELI